MMTLKYSSGNTTNDSGSNIIYRNSSLLSSPCEKKFPGVGWRGTYLICSSHNFFPLHLYKSIIVKTKCLENN